MAAAAGGGAGDVNAVAEAPNPPGRYVDRPFCAGQKVRPRDGALNQAKAAAVSPEQLHEITWWETHPVRLGRRPSRIYSVPFQ